MKKILISVAALMLGVLGYATTRPDSFEVKRSISIRAPSAAVFGHLNDFRHWTEWSPWEKVDPALRRTYTGAAHGVGAIYEWVGNDTVGQGRMEIVEAMPTSRVALKLDFIKPFEAHNQVVFTLEPQGAATAVTWVMSGPSPFISKLIGLFVSMDTMIGRDFETGLANLKALAEKS
jgi:hypothetical protein